MTIRTIVKLEDDILAGVKRESLSRSVPFDAALNELLREALSNRVQKPFHRALKITPVPMGCRPGLNYDDIESLIEFGEGELHR